MIAWNNPPLAVNSIGGDNDAQMKRNETGTIHDSFNGTNLPAQAAYETYGPPHSPKIARNNDTKTRMLRWSAPKPKCVL